MQRNPGRAPRTALRGAAAALLLAASGLSAPSGAGQAGSSFNVTIIVEPPTNTCTAAVLDSGVPQVNCRPAVIGVGGTGNGTGGGERHIESALGYRIPDARMKLAGAVVELGEENFHAWGEYSSRMILAGGIEYVEMTVTW